MEEKKVSVIIPVYNVKEYVEKCVETVIKQTYSNLEIILVDDGATDGSGEICDKLACKDQRIEVIHKKNGGLSDARNAGLKVVTGEYYLFVDSDDWISVNMVKRLVDCAEKEDADIVSCGFFDVMKDEIINIPDNLDVQNLNREEALKSILEGQIRDYAWNKIYKRQVFDGLSYPVGRNYEDMATTYKAFLKAQKVSVLSESLYYYIQREGSISNSENKYKILKNKYDALISHYERIEIISSDFPNLRNLCIRNFYDRVNSFMDYAFLSYKEKSEQKTKMIQETIWCMKKYYEEIQKDNKYKKLRKWKTKSYMQKNRVLIWGYTGIDYLRKCTPDIIKQNLLKIKNHNHNRSLEKKGKTAVFLIGTPDHNNLGDHAIAYATIEYFNRILSDKYILIEISEEDFLNNSSQIQKSVCSEDIIVIQGGGNWGDTYKYIEKMHNMVLKKFNQNKILVMPQTIHFTKKENLEKCKKLINKCRHITFLTREKKSYNLAKEYFSDIDIKFIPDMVLSLNKSNRQPQNIAMCCLRSDKEGCIQVSEKLYLHEFLESQFASVLYTDTCIENRVNKTQRQKELEKKWEQFNEVKVIVTDRLHGMIFAAITGTPCIVLGNYNHKVEAAYEWLKEVPYIKFASKLSEVPYIIQNDIDLDKIYSYSGMDEKYYNSIATFFE